MSDAGVDTEPTPVLSVVVAIRNEATHVSGLLDSLLAQDVGVPYEVLVVDGGSTDGTRELIERHVADGDRQVRLVDNPQRTTPFAFNAGLTAARGDYLAILGAHCRYPVNYLSTCLEVVANAATPTGCGGLVRTVATSEALPARLAAAVMSNSFASSSRSFRTHAAGEVDGIPYPVYRTADVRGVGGFDERLERNQDNDMSERLRAAGVTLVVTDKATCDYLARDGVADLCRYAYRSGRWNGRTARMGLNVMKVRHYVPGGFVAVLGLGVAAACSRRPLGKLARAGVVTTLVAHQTLAVRSVESDAGAVMNLLVPPSILAFHLSYGAGTIAGLLARPS